MYTIEDKELMDEIFQAFGEYIKQHKYFDIVYSDKVGYVKIAVDPYFDEEIRKIDSPEDFLFLLFMEIANDYLFPDKCHTYNDSIYRENVSLKISEILATMDKAKEFSFTCFEKFRQNYRTIATHKHTYFLLD